MDRNGDLIFSSGNIQLLGSKQLCKSHSLQGCSKCINFPSECLRMCKFLCLSLVHLCDSGPLSLEGCMHPKHAQPVKDTSFFKNAVSFRFVVTSIMAVTNGMANSDHLHWVVYAACWIWCMRPSFPLLKKQKGNAIALQGYYKTKEWFEIRIACVTVSSLSKCLQMLSRRPDWETSPLNFGFDMCCFPKENLVLQYLQYVRHLIHVRSLDKKQPPIRTECKDLEKFLQKDRQIKCTLLKQKSFNRSFSNFNKMLDMTKPHLYAIWFG